MTLTRVLTLLKQVTAALLHLHSLGILHRDLRAANILIDSLDPVHLLVAYCGVSSGGEGQPRDLTALRGGVAPGPMQVCCGVTFSACWRRDWCESVVGFVTVPCPSCAVLSSEGPLSVHSALDSDGVVSHSSLCAVPFVPRTRPSSPPPLPVSGAPLRCVLAPPRWTPWSPPHRMCTWWVALRTSC